MAAEGLPVEVACRVLDVSVSGYYAWLSRPPSARAIRHAWLTDLITEVHQGSRGIYGARRVHAELRLGRGVVVGHGAVELLMRRAGIKGVTGRQKWKHAKPDLISRDLVDRQFTRSGPNQLWVTDITEHHTPWIPAVVATVGPMRRSVKQSGVLLGSPTRGSFWVFR